MTEPVIVVGNREDLWYLPAEAAQLEHMIVCQHLYVEFSLKTGTDEGAERRTGWRAPKSAPHWHMP